MTSIVNKFRTLPSFCSLTGVSTEHIADAEKTLVKREDSLNFFKGDWLHLYNSLTPENKQVFWKTHIKEIYVDPNTHLLCGFIFR